MNFGFWIFNLSFLIGCGKNKKSSALALAAFLFVLSPFVEAQQTGRVHCIGMLVSGSVATHGHRMDAFRQRLRELGYIEGMNIIIEYRYAEGKREQFAELAAEIIRLRPEVIYVSGTGFSRAAKKATTIIPIVSTGGDLVEAGLVSSLAQRVAMLRDRPIFPPMLPGNGFNSSTAKRQHCQSLSHCCDL